MNSCVVFIFLHNRDAGDGFYVVRYEAFISLDFLSRRRIGLPYKYVVYSPRTITVGHQYEFLHSAYPYEYHANNRLLKVPHEKLYAESNFEYILYAAKFL